MNNYHFKLYVILLAMKWRTKFFQWLQPYKLTCPPIVTLVNWSAADLHLVSLTTQHFCRRRSFTQELSESVLLKTHVADSSCSLPGLLARMNKHEDLQPTPFTNYNQLHHLPLVDVVFGCFYTWHMHFHHPYIYIHSVLPSRMISISNYSMLQRGDWTLFSWT